MFYGGGMGHMGGNGPIKYGSNNRHIQEMIVRQAQSAGVDPRVMLALIAIETGGTFNPYSRNPSGAAGLGQIMPENWKAMGLNAQTVFDPVKNIQATIKMTKSNIAYFRKQVGRLPSAEELYLLHQQGAGGATALLKHSGSRAVDALKTLTVYGSGRRSALEAVRQNLPTAQRSRAGSISAGEFAGFWLNQARSKLRKYGFY